MLHIAFLAYYNSRACVWNESMHTFLGHPQIAPAQDPYAVDPHQNFGFDPMMQHYSGLVILQFIRSKFDDN